MTEYNTDTVNARVEEVWKETGLAFIPTNIENELGVSYGVAQRIDLKPIPLDTLARISAKLSKMLKKTYVPLVILCDGKPAYGIKPNRQNPHIYAADVFRQAYRGVVVPEGEKKRLFFNRTVKENGAKYFRGDLEFSASQRTKLLEEVIRALTATTPHEYIAAYLYEVPKKDKKEKTR